MTLPNRKAMKCDILYEDCPIQMYEHEFLVDLYKFEFTESGVILGINWLVKYQA